jgi:hypothetical protein
MIDRTIMALSLPMGVNEKKVTKAYQKFDGLRSQYNVAFNDVTALEAAVKEAERVDRQAYGKALADGKPDPGATAVAEAKASLDEGKRRRDALEHAVNTTYPDVVDAVVTTREQWQTELAEEFRTSAVRYEEAVDELGDAHAAFADVIATLNWLEKFANGEVRRKKTGAAHLSELPRLIQRNGDPYSVDAVIRALRDLGDLDRLAGRAGSVD